MLLINNNNSSSSIMNRKLSKSIMLFKIRINRDTVKIAAYSVIKTSYLLKIDRIKRSIESFIEE